MNRHFSLPAPPWLVAAFGFNWSRARLMNDTKAQRARAQKVARGVASAQYSIGLIDGSPVRADSWNSARRMRTRIHRRGILTAARASLAMIYRDDALIDAHARVGRAALSWRNGDQLSIETIVVWCERLLVVLRSIRIIFWRVWQLVERNRYEGALNYWDITKVVMARAS